MSNEITVGHSEEFASNVGLLSQQMDSRFRGAVTVENKTGKSAQMINQVSAVTAQKKTTRHADTPLIPTPHDSRWVYPVDYEWADLIDKNDDIGVRSIVSFESSYVKNGAASMNRALDSEVMDAFFSDTTKTGEDAGTTTDWTTFVSANAAHQIAHGSAGLTKNKILAALKALRAANVDLSRERVYMGVSSGQIEDLYGIDEFASLDYTANRAFDRQAGDLPSWLGVQFIHYEDVTNDGTTWNCPLWVPSGIGLGVFDAIQGRVSERDDKSYAKQVYVCGTFGATRLEEKKIVEVQCQ